MGAATWKIWVFLSLRSRVVKNEPPSPRRCPGLNITSLEHSRVQTQNQTRPVWRQRIQYRGDLHFSCCYRFTICLFSNAANVSSPIHPKVQTTSVLYSLRLNWQPSISDAGYNNKSFPTRLLLQETYAEANNLSVPFHVNFEEKEMRLQREIIYLVCKLQTADISSITVSQCVVLILI